VLNLGQVQPLPRPLSHFDQPAVDDQGRIGLLRDRASQTASTGQRARIYRIETVAGEETADGLNLRPAFIAQGASSRP
jgi:hypothetical protein